MARQSNTPVMFERTTRRDTSVNMTSGRAGVVVPVGYVPVLRGDSASGRVGIDVDMAEMPRPLLNTAGVNFQAWFVPKSAHPQFSGMDEFIHAYHGDQIKSLGAADRNPPAFFIEVDGADLVTATGSEMFEALGLHVSAGQKINSDLIDAFNLIYNFRLAAHSSRLTRRAYASEDIDEATTLPRAFWSSGRFASVVPDYERALVVGSLNLDVLAGSLPVSGIGTTYNPTSSAATIYETGQVENATNVFPTSTVNYRMAEDPDHAGWPAVYAEMADQSIGITLADIDKARLTQAFSKLRTAYAGNDATGFDNDDTIVAEMMQGFQVPPDSFKRPWLLDSKVVPVGMAERFATDAANLDSSVTTGRASVVLSLNLPRTETGGVIMFTVEMMPERLDERQSDEWLYITDTADLPDALRDVQRPEPVDMVLSRRVDALHTTPDALFGYEPMNNVWNREFTRLGGSFYQDDPLNPWTDQRSAIWQTSIVDPELTADHWLAPVNFPHDVFSDTTAPAFEVVCRHMVTLVGLTQIGDVLQENNDDYEAVAIPEE